MGVEKEKLFGILGEINYKIKEYLGGGRNNYIFTMYDCSLLFSPIGFFTAERKNNLFIKNL